MHWRIHRGLLGGRTPELLALFSGHPLLREDGLQLVTGSPLDLAAPVPGQGGPGLALTTLQDARRLRSWEMTPGLYYHPERYHVSRWMPRIDPAIPVLNRGCVFTPVGLIPWLDLPVPKSGLFVRPDSGLKPFPGWALSPEQDTWAKVHSAILWVRPDIEPDAMACLSAARSLDDVEWRFWVVNREVIAHTPYSWETEPAWVPAPEPARAVAEAMARNPWQPDIAYVVDVVRSGPDWYLNELNAASTSGLYQVPLGDLIPALRTVAMLEWAGEIAQEGG